VAGLTISLWVVEDSDPATRTREAGGPDAMLILLAAPKAREYYPHIGFTPHDSCWYLPRQSD